MTIGNTGLLGAQALPANTSAWVKVYTAPAGYATAAEININNTNASGAAHISWAVSSQATTPLAAEVRETKTAVAAGAPMCVTTSVGAGQSVFAQSDTANVNFLVNGFEESTS
jgi:hypothetical protein